MRRFVVPVVLLAACAGSDPSAPTLDAPGDGAVLQEGTTTAFSGTVTDADGAAFTFSLDGATLCGGTVEAGNFGCEAVVQLPGATGVQAEAELAVAIDDGDTQRVAARMVSVRLSSPPAAQIAAPTDDDVAYADVAVELLGSVSDVDDPIEALDAVWESSIDGPLDTVLEADGTARAEAYLSPGRHELALVVRDAAGRQGRASASLRVVATNHAPSCSAHADAHTVGEGEPVTLRARVSDHDERADRLSVALFEGEVALGQASVDPLGDVVVTLPDLSVGSHPLVVVATDSAGLTCASAVDVVVDGAPTVLVDAPRSQVFGEDETVVLTGRVSDPSDPAVRLIATWTLADGTEVGGGRPDADGVVSLRTAALPVGEQEVTLSVADPLGQVGQATTSFRIDGAPSAPEIAIDPGTATAEDDLVARITADSVDPEGDTVQYRYVWSRSSGPLPGDAVEGATLDAALTARGETWNLVVTPSDGYGQGWPAYASITIGNAEPVLAGATITPSAPVEGDVLSCEAGAVSDADGDEVSFKYAWMVDEVEVSASTRTLDDSWWSRDQEVTCRVVPSDGYTTGVEVTAAPVTVRNSPPLVASVSISPTDPSATDVLTCAYSGFEDADGDADLSTLSWTVDGATVGTGPTLSSGFVGGNQVSCAVTPDDGTDTGPMVTGRVTVHNTAPELSGVTLVVSAGPGSPGSSSSATEADTLICVAGSTSDIDGDTVTVHYGWIVSGAELGMDSATLTGDNFAKGDTVSCTATPNDGVDDGTAVSSSSISIVNTAPELFTAVIDADAYGTDAVLAIAATGNDEDGDPVDLAVDWYVNGSFYGNGATLDGAEAFERGDVVYAEVTPNDGDTDGATLTTAEVTIVNTAPTAPSVSLVPDSFVIGVDDLGCTVDVASFDADGDAVDYAVSWTADGAAYPDDVVDAVGPSTDVLDGDTVPALDVGLALIWTCSVVPFDADEDGPAGEATLDLSTEP